MAPPAPTVASMGAHVGMGGPGPAVHWKESFDGGPLSWIAPFGHTTEQISAVYSLEREGSAIFLHARHDARPNIPSRTKAINLGNRFDPDPPALDRVSRLRWRWRVKQHPTTGDDPWLDAAASVYVIIRQPSLIRKGKGFKFGWLRSHAPPGTSQMGLAQVELRADPASPEWKHEEVDLCALHRKFFGPCEGEHLRYLGVLTDADGTESVAEGDYSDFALE